MPTHTRLSRYCEGLIEAGWLLALISAPLFFNLYGNLVFERHKIALIRWLALLMAAAWLVRFLEKGSLRFERIPVAESKSRWRSLLHQPLLIPVLAYVGAAFLSTLFSIAPHLSLMGSYARSQGAYTLLAYVVIAASIAAHLRRQSQLQRLLDTIILTSLAISLYSLLQQAGLDPLKWQWLGRIPTTLGNAGFAGGYLIMVFPITLVCAGSAIRDVLSAGQRRSETITRSAIYLLAAMAQLAALWNAGSRGPWLGWLVSSFCLAFIFSLLHHRRRWALGLVGLAVVGVGFLALLNVPNGPLESLRATPNIDRMGRLFEGRNVRARLIFGQGALQLTLPHEPLLYPDGQSDRLNFLRPLLGYGPETMFPVFRPFYPPELEQLLGSQFPDRSHNDTYDALVFGGLIGLLAHLALFTAAFYYALYWLGLIPTASQRRLYFGLYAGGGIISALGLALALGPGYFGVGLPLGIVLGIIVYLTTCAIADCGLRIAERDKNPKSEIRNLKSSHLLIGLLAALLAHFIEIHFGIATSATRLYFWSYTALVFVVGHGLSLPAPQKATQPVRPARSRRRRKPKSTHTHPALRLWAAPAAVGGLLINALMLTLGYDFLVNSQRLTNPGDIFLRAVTTLHAHDGSPSLGILFLLGLTWLAALALFSFHSPSIRHGRQKRPNRWVVFLGSLVVSAALTATFWSLHLRRLAIIAGALVDNINALLALVEQVQGVYTGYVAGLGVTALALGIVLPLELALRPEDASKGWPSTTFRRGAISVLLAALVFGAALLMGSLANVRSVQADIVVRNAFAFEKQGQYEPALALYREATTLAPREYQYFIMLDRLNLKSVNQTDDPNERISLFQGALNARQTAQALNPINPDLQTYDQTLLVLGDLYVAQADAGIGDRSNNLETAAGYYEQAIDLLVVDGRTPHQATLIALGSTYQSLDRDEQALTTFQQALNIAPDSGNVWIIHEALTDLYKGQDETAPAREHAELAFATAPESEQERFRAILNGLLWNEWGQYDLSVQSDLDAAEEQLLHALTLDPNAGHILLLLGDLYVARTNASIGDRVQNLELAAEFYERALALQDADDALPSLTTQIALGSTYELLERDEEAAAAYQQALGTAPPGMNFWSIHEALAELHLRRGDSTNAREHAEMALAAAPASERARIQALLDSIGTP